MKLNYQKMLDEIIEDIKKEGYTPSLLLHSCCGPCSSYVLEYLTQYFKVTLLYYNPNIQPKEEYLKRVETQKQIIAELPVKNKVDFIEGDYDDRKFFEAVKGFENEREGGLRCERCFRLRMEQTALLAKEKGFDFFTTTLSVSPHKNADILHSVGIDMQEKYGVKYLPADFKKREGYKRSIELSKKYNLYRQNYCGCIFSLKEAQAQQE
nr:epoxyqueuosine reductase QueH [Clostridiales bacterium]